MKLPFSTRRHSADGGRRSRNTAPRNRSPEHEEQRGNPDPNDDFPATERPSLQPFDAREPVPLRSRVALPWVVLNALIVAAVLWARPTQDSPPGPPTSIAETTPRTTAPVISELEGRVAAERAAAPNRSAITGHPAPSDAPSKSGSPKEEDEASEPLTIYPVLAVEGRLFALEGVETRQPSRDGSSRRTSPSKKTTTLALPGGGALEVTPRTSDAPTTDAWTVLSSNGTCVAQRGPEVRLAFDPGEPGAELPAPLDAHELRNCNVEHDMNDHTVAIAGSHRQARYEALEEGTVRLVGGTRAFERDGADSCEGSVRLTTREGALLRDEPGVALSGRIQLPGRDLLVLEGEAGLRVLEVRGDEVSVAASEPFAPLWLGALDPYGC